MPKHVDYKTKSGPIKLHAENGFTLVQSHAIIYSPVSPLFRNTISAVDT